jgi:phosphoribosylanthranilate isomerase
MIVQIYGLTTPEDAAAVVAAGADNAGVVLDEGFDAWDSVDAATARAILSELATITVVGLSLSVDADQIRRTVDVIEPQIAHVVRITDEWEPDAVSTLREQLAPVELMCTVGVRDERAIGVARRYAPVCDYLLLDSPHPSTGIVGATGVTHDWALSARIVAAVETPVVLAGGLGPDNVEAAIAATQPFGVDSETRTSRADDRRRKDPARVEEFVRRVRALGR